MPGIRRDYGWDTQRPKSAKWAFGAIFQPIPASVVTEFLSLTKNLTGPHPPDPFEIFQQYNLLALSSWAAMIRFWLRAMSWKGRRSMYLCLLLGFPSAGKSCHLAIIAAVYRSQRPELINQEKDTPQTTGPKLCGAGAADRGTAYCVTMWKTDGECGIST